jgi:oligoribonuclease
MKIRSGIIHSGIRGDRQLGVQRDQRHFDHPLTLPGDFSRGDRETSDVLVKNSHPRGGQHPGNIRVRPLFSSHITGTGQQEGAPVLVWMDLEMTGLDPKRHTIVEIATLITDDDLAIIAEGPDLVVHARPEDLAEMDDFVRKMHAKSGLLPAIEASTLTLEEAGRQTLEFIRAHVPEPRTVPLCGNSIGTDRRFLVEHLPEIEDWLHYRSVDVSTVKELCRRWYPEILKTAPAKQTAHRALDDIRESIGELAWYRTTIFRLPPGNDTPPSEPDRTAQ